MLRWHAARNSRGGSSPATGQQRNVLAANDARWTRSKAARYCCWWRSGVVEEKEEAAERGVPVCRAHKGEADSSWRLERSWVRATRWR